MRTYVVALNEPMTKVITKIIVKRVQMILNFYLQESV